MTRKQAVKADIDTSPATQKDRQYVTALARGLDILRCFDAVNPSLGISDIARMTGMPQPTVWRLCHTLICDGYLVQSDRKEKLRPGIPVLTLGYAAIAATPIGELAREDMLALAKQSEGAVSLGERDGTSMIYLQRCQGSDIILRDMRVGSRVPVLTSTTGWAYLAGLTKARRSEVLRELKAADPKLYREQAQKIEQALSDFDVDGYVVNLGSLHPRINAVGVPVVSADGSRVLSLSSGGINDQFTPEKLRAVGQALKKLAKQLGSVLAADMAK